MPLIHLGKPKADTFNFASEKSGGGGIFEISSDIILRKLLMKVTIL